ncbi:hypothetical protein H8356DRAFT_1707681 [Neocallimastix lanati (nom. inval.)]|jgi:hypothetical protein|uniref:Autophagy-related protein 27 n=1 Tax=Neocallimastix californiae TaxID=1754190 RepID=A0A1Y2FKV7_9FUNG|nr:hypothetical protein H8356DRAFT_1707681 [Neocallimastix sp. JGI-2020a]ORY84598.1 hypothetical protein LY90DRAFT_663612 [Neocallimastix californiae]|eukprot:ORY84598.1 hypothetical protein LY90DRAFT_663612 [Neocallimastix californiae]
MNIYIQTVIYILTILQLTSSSNVNLNEENWLECAVVGETSSINGLYESFKRPFLKTVGNFGNKFIEQSSTKYIFNPIFCECYSENGNCRVAFEGTSFEDNIPNRNLNLIAEFEMTNSLKNTTFTDIYNDIKIKESCKNFKQDINNDKIYFGNTYEKENSEVIQGGLFYNSIEEMIKENITFPLFFEPKNNCNERLAIGKFRISNVKECKVDINPSNEIEVSYNREGFNKTEVNCDWGVRRKIEAKKEESSNRSSKLYSNIAISLGFSFITIILSLY